MSWLLFCILLWAPNSYLVYVQVLNHKYNIPIYSLANYTI